MADYKAREAKKTEKAAATEGNDKDSKDKDKEAKSASSPGPAVAPISVPGTPPAAANPQTHKKYALHRQIFEMRKMELKRKEQGVKAKEVGRGELQVRLILVDQLLIWLGLPQVPRGNF